MTIQSISRRNPLLFLIAVWAVVLFVVVIASVFLHEDGHGIGARIDGIHVSTGFNKVGNYGRSPDDPDFRTTGSGSDQALWSGLLGPITTWLLAIIFTIWLYRFKGPSWGALVVGAIAIVNGLIRAVPMTLFLVSALGGHPYMEDEVGWGIWYVIRFCRPDLANSTLDYHALVRTYADVFLADPTFWIPPLFSLLVSLACLIFAYRRMYSLYRDRLPHWTSRLLFGLLPLGMDAAAYPVLNWLDRLIRINW